jgi:uncharacterized membrane protein
MSSKPVPPVPPPPEFPEKPRKSSWTLVLAGIALLFIMTALSFLTLGYFTPVVVLGVGMFGMIGLQYLVWGWYFEKIYRQGRDLLDD